MRAVKAVLTAAAALKRSAPPESDEARLCLRALRDVNVPKFLPNDIELFDGIARDLFPGVTPLETEDLRLRAAVGGAALRLGLQPTDQYVGKALELASMLAVRHGLMLVGPPSGGKTSAYRSLANAYAQLAEEDLSNAEAAAEAARQDAEAEAVPALPAFLADGAVALDSSM
ncbi:hypothetical protein T492DRAFT_890115 [Pavlovales sp. CCMP2436]|nr:hypothetical protein T492DRAFT_890115 [Pavlovales sp. CCMP2436]